MPAWSCLRPPFQALRSGDVAAADHLPPDHTGHNAVADQRERTHPLRGSRRRSWSKSRRTAASSRRRDVAGAPQAPGRGAAHAAGAAQRPAPVRGTRRASRLDRVPLHTLRHSAASFLLAARTRRSSRSTSGTAPTSSPRTSAATWPRTSSARPPTSSPRRSAGDVRREPHCGSGCCTHARGGPEVSPTRPRPAVSLSG